MALAAIIPSCIAVRPPWIALVTKVWSTALELVVGASGGPAIGIEFGTDGNAVPASAAWTYCVSARCSVTRLLLPIAAWMATGLPPELISVEAPAMSCCFSVTTSAR